MIFPYVLEARWPGGTIAQSQNRFLADLAPGLGDPEYLALLDPVTMRLRLLLDGIGMAVYSPPNGKPKVSHVNLKPGDSIVRIYHALQAQRLPSGEERVTAQVLIIEVLLANGKTQVIGLALDTEGNLDTVLLEGRRGNAVQAGQ